MANPLTREELEAIKARMSLATPGPWEVLHPEAPEDFDGPYPKWRGVIGPSPDAVIVEKCGGEGYTDSILNADFIAHARTDIVSLLSEVERLRDENEALASLTPDQHRARIVLAASRGALSGLTSDEGLAEAARGYRFASRTLEGDAFETAFLWAREIKDGSERAMALPYVSAALREARAKAFDEAAALARKFRPEPNGHLCGAMHGEHRIQWHTAEEIARALEKAKDQKPHG